MKERRSPIIPIIIVVGVLGIAIAAMFADVPARTMPTEVDVTLPAAAPKAE